MVIVLERSFANKQRANRATAQAIAALSIGGVVVARTPVDRTQADQLRAGCMAAALHMRGWGKTRAGRLSKESVAFHGLKGSGGARR
jgi:hypothetical protein